MRRPCQPSALAWLAQAEFEAALRELRKWTDPAADPALQLLAAAAEAHAGRPALAIKALSKVGATRAALAHLACHSWAQRPCAGLGWGLQA